jgi:carbonic anhydrase
MKKTLLLSIFCLIVSVLSAQTEKAAWDYPVKPGMEEWRNTSYAEKIEKSQPPKELLAGW